MHTKSERILNGKQAAKRTATATANAAAAAAAAEPPAGAKYKAQPRVKPNRASQTKPVRVRVRNMGNGKCQGTVLQPNNYTASHGI